MDELIELYGDEFYDSPHLVSRKRIDNIADVPVLDDDGKEKLIYNIDGYRVVRRYPLIPDNDVTYCGIFCNFDGVPLPPLAQPVLEHAVIDAAGNQAERDT